MNKKKKRIPLPVKIILCVLIPVILIVGGFAVKMIYENSKMSPIPTGELVPNSVYVVKDGNANLYLVKGGDGYIAIDAGNGVKQTSSALDKTCNNRHAGIYIYGSSRVYRCSRRYLC